MEFEYPADVLQVTIDDRFFVNSQKGPFYEQIPAGNDFYYIQRQARLISEGKGAGYGGSSSTSAITNIGKVKGAGGNYVTLKLDEKFAVKMDSSYYLKIKNKFKRFSSVEKHFVNYLKGMKLK